MLDQALRARALVSSAPRDLWIAAQLDAVDPWQRVTALAEARARAPDEKLFVASLAMACLAPLQPLPPECDATDRLADWATRDADNGVPSLLLADRARRRNNTASMAAFLEEAAMRPRFDDYENRGALIVWETVRSLPGTVDPAARAEAAAAFGAGHASQVPAMLQALCRDAARVADNIRTACANAGNAAAQRGSSWSLRIAGAKLAERAQASERAAAGVRRAATRLRVRAGGQSDRAGTRVERRRGARQGGGAVGSAARPRSDGRRSRQLRVANPAFPSAP